MEDPPRRRHRSPPPHPSQAAPLRPRTGRPRPAAWRRRRRPAAWRRRPRRRGNACRTAHRQPRRRRSAGGRRGRRSARRGADGGHRWAGGGGRDGGGGRGEAGSCRARRRPVARPAAPRAGPAAAQGDKRQMRKHRDSDGLRDPSHVAESSRSRPPGSTRSRSHSGTVTAGPAVAVLALERRFACAPRRHAQRICAQPGRAGGGSGSRGARPTVTRLAGGT